MSFDLVSFVTELRFQISHGGISVAFVEIGATTTTTATSVFEGKYLLDN